MAGQVLGFVGLGRMGGPMSLRLIDAGYSLCVYDTDAAAMKPLVARGAKAAKQDSKRPAMPSTKATSRAM